MTVTIYQPQYFPRLHYFNRILSSDFFVLLDSAQYTKNLAHITPEGIVRHVSYQSDTPIKTSQGEYLLTVSTKHAGLLPICQTKLEYMHKWHMKHRATIKVTYGKATMFSVLFPEIQSLLAREYETLAELNTMTILWGIARSLGLNISMHELTIENVNRALQSKKNVRLNKIVSDTKIDVQRPEGQQKGTEWTAAICQALGATEYLHGGTAQAMYMDLAYYKKRGIIPIAQDWKCPEYTQQFSKIGFLPNLSIVDLLLNEEQAFVQKTLGIS